MTAPPRALKRLLSGITPAHVAVMELLTETQSLEEAARLLRGAGARARAEEALALLQRELPGCARVVRMIRTLDLHTGPAESVAAGLAACRRLFDAAVLESEEASVALYSLGSARLLEQSTLEVVSAMRARGVLAPSRHALELGCGIGRMLVALAPELASLVGVDLSQGMVNAATRRTATLSNVTVRGTEGRDLLAFEDERFDLVFAVDTLPYLVQAGAELVARHFAETRRVLKPGGDFLFFAYSYRGTASEDVEDVRALACEAGLRCEALGLNLPNLWAGELFHLQR